MSVGNILKSLGEQIAKKGMEQGKDIFNPEDSKLYDPDIVSLIDSLANEFTMGNTPDVYKYIGELESNNNPLAESGISSAKGIYQFTPAAVEATKRSAKRGDYRRSYSPANFSLAIAQACDYMQDNSFSFTRTI